MIKDSTPQAVESCHQLLLWLVPQLDKFPRNRRYTLGEKMESNLLSVLENLIAAAYQHRKKSLLDEANRKLSVVRHLWRLAMELNAVSHKSYEHGAKLMVELGNQIGGWVKHEKSRRSLA
ncbi:diversity-generating retroelement protein Avd [Mariprofundus sp. EBB-1]|uniref:diversity-generating retroelement protein Avd n=1 Tax=Mariprofundus sp. EBB-1 TaxID=2650971 RepID=UPI000EF1CD73|nr:diversity-generating retroelement protein Avd [Mariprofundus sp. EBB-1]RLL48977.1 diversity-generating retroelement protein Avd [Mariprofundus sp. EBB-1]